MFSSIMNYLANQARKPTGWFGRLVAPLVFSHENKHMENFGLEVLDPQSEEEILEIGFGHGRLLYKLSRTIRGGKVCGIDISKQMVNAAANRNKEWIKKGKVELLQASIADIPYPANSFDKVFTCNTIYFWAKPPKDIEEVKRVLKPNGQFFCAFRDKQLMESKGSAVTDNREVFQNLYEAEKVIKLFKGAGFNQVTHDQTTKNSEEVHIVKGSI